MRNLCLIVLLLMFSLDGFSGTGAIPQGSNILLLKDNLKFKNTDTKILTNDTDSPTAVAKSADEGSLYIQNGTGYIFRKTDAGSSVNWSPMLGGTAGLGTDNCVVRWDGTSVPLLQTSLFCITDLGVGTGLTSLTVASLTMATDTISSTGDITLLPTTLISLPTMTASAPLYVNATNDLASLPLTNGQLIIGSTGANPVAAALTGTANQISVTNGAGSITVATPQDIHSGASPTFVDMTLSGLVPGSALFAGVGGLISEDNANFFWDDTNNRLGLLDNTPSFTLDVNGTAQITGNITTNITASRAVITDAGSILTASPTTSTEIGFVSGVTSSIQTQLNGKEPTIATGGATQYWRGDKVFATINSDHLTEGATNLFFTDARARTAAVADAIVDGVTNIAPSQNAVFDALALKADDTDLANYVEIAGDTMTGALRINTDLTVDEDATIKGYLRMTSDPSVGAIVSGSNSGVVFMNGGSDVGGLNGAQISAYGITGAAPGDLLLAAGQGSGEVIFRTNALVMGDITQAGKWTIGQAAGTQSHAVNGNIVVTGNIHGSGSGEFEGKVAIKNQNVLELQDSGGGQAISIRSNATVSTPYTVTLPAAQGANGQVLVNDGSGNLDWENSSGGLNLLENASFEYGLNFTCNHANQTCAQSSTEAYHPVTGGQSALIDASSAATYDAELCVTNTSLENMNGQVTCRIWTSSTVFNFCSSDDVTSCLDSKDIAGNSAWTPYTATMAVPAAGKLCARVTSDAGTTDNIYIDACEFTEFKPFTKQAKQYYRIRQLQNALTDISASLEYNLGTATILNSGAQIIVASDDAGNTRTKFTAQRDAWVHVRSHATVAVANSSQVRHFNSAGTVLYDFQTTASYTSNSNVEGGAHFKMAAGDFFTHHATVPSTGDNASIEFVAYSDESESIDLPALPASAIAWAAAGCAASTTSASFTTFSDTDCQYNDSGVTKIGTTQAPVSPLTDGDIALSIPSVPAGKYEVCVNGFYYTDSVAGAGCAFRLFDGTNTVWGSVFASETAAYGRGDGFCGIVEYVSNQTNLQWQFQADRLAGTSTCNMQATGTDNGFSISLKPISGVMSASLKDTVKIAPSPYSYQPIRHSCRIDVSGAATINDESKLCNGVTASYTGAGVSRMNFTAPYLFPPVCTVSSRSTSNPTAIIFETATTYVEVRTFSTIFGAADANYYVTCEGFK